MQCQLSNNELLTDIQEEITDRHTGGDNYEVIKVGRVSCRFEMGGYARLDWTR